MSKINDAIKSYESYLARMSGVGILNAANEAELTAWIKLTDGKINMPKMTRDFLNDTISKNAVFEEYAKNHGSEYVEIKALIEDYPEVRTALSFIEVGTHEVIHAIQKHSYRSVYSLVDAMQNIENLELKLFFSHAANGGSWKKGESFLASLEALARQEPNMSSIADSISRYCETVIEATNPKDSGLGLLHLVEGQAFVASRLANGTFDALPFPAEEIYTKAWDAYKKAGGKEGLVFTLVVGAALRYGDIEVDSDGYYPHPVDIYEYLLNFLKEFEQIFEDMDKKPATSKISRLFPVQKNIAELVAEVSDDKNYKYLKRISDAVLDKSNKGIYPKDSNDEWLSYVQYKVTDADFDSHEERIRLEKQHRYNVFCVFDDLLEQYNVSPERNESIKRLVVISKSISTAVATAYSRVAESMNDEFPKAENKKISDAVGNYVAVNIPDYYKEETFIRLLFDQDFVLERLFKMFSSDLNEDVVVKPYDHMPEMTHLDYSSLSLMPSLIKNLLSISSWKKGNITYSPPLPYCCEKHGKIAFIEANPELFDKCNQEDSVGRAFKIMFSRSVNSFFTN